MNNQVEFQKNEIVYINLSEYKKWYYENVGGFWLFDGCYAFYLDNGQTYLHDGEEYLGVHGVYKGVGAGVPVKFIEKLPSEQFNWWEEQGNWTGNVWFSEPNFSLPKEELELLKKKV